MHRDALLLADVWDMVSQTAVVVNVAGPFMLTNADLLVEGCLHAGTHYVDVSGEVPFTARLIERYHRAAKATGTMIVPNAAFAGGAVDIATYCVAKHARQCNNNKPVRQVMVYTSMNKASIPSGGTLATRQAMASSMRDFGRLMADPFALGTPLSLY